MTGTKPHAAADSEAGLTLIDWDTVEVEASAAMLAAIQPVMRETADRLYGELLNAAQDYLADNIQWNIAERIAVAERQSAKYAAVNTELLHALEELYAIVTGECPRLLDEDSGANPHTEMHIMEAIVNARGPVVMTGPTLYREIDALGGDPVSEFDAGYVAALDRVLAIMTRRGFSEFVEAVPQRPDYVADMQAIVASADGAA